MNATFSIIVTENRFCVHPLSLTQMINDHHRVTSASTMTGRLSLSKSFQFSRTLWDIVYGCTLTNNSRSWGCKWAWLLYQRSKLRRYICRTANFPHPVSPKQDFRPTLLATDFWHTCFLLFLRYWNNFVRETNAAGFIADVVHRQSWLIFVLILNKCW